MSKKLANPPAFPILHPGDFSNAVPAHGMTMRDYFATAMLPETADTYPEWQLRDWFGDQGGITRERIRARAAYAYADAMLAERAKGGDQ